MICAKCGNYAKWGPNGEVICNEDGITTGCE